MLEKLLLSVTNAAKKKFMVAPAATPHHTQLRLLLGVSLFNECVYRLKLSRYDSRALDAIGS
jgi:hypothetical protein